jgi:hypothetical protein
MFCWQYITVYQYSEMFCWPYITVYQYSEMFCWPYITVHQYSEMVCWPYITVYQYSETNVMYFLFNLLRIKSLYMNRTLLAHPQEVLYKEHLVYCVRVMSVGFTRTGVKLQQPTDITCTQYTKCRLGSASWGWASNARNMYRSLSLNKPNKKCITLVLLYWYTAVKKTF